MQNKIISFIWKRANALALFSLSCYGITILGMLWKEITEKSILPYYNAVNGLPLFYSVAVMAIGISLYKSYRKIKSNNNSVYALFWRSGTELQMMLCGTLAALMFNLGILFSHSPEIHIAVSIFAGIMIGLNIERDRIVDWSYNKWINCAKSQKKSY